MRTSGGPIVSLFYSLFPIVTAVIITVCYVGIWVTIQVTIWVAKTSRDLDNNKGEPVVEKCLL